MSLILPSFDESIRSIEDIQTFLRELVCRLVDNPEWVRVDYSLACESTEFLVEVVEADVARIIGKNGRTAQSIRVILNALGVKHSHRFTLRILEEVERTDTAN